MFKKEFKASVSDTHSLLNEVLFGNKIKINEKFEITLSLGFIIKEQNEKFITIKGPELNKIFSDIIDVREEYKEENQEKQMFNVFINLLDYYHNHLKEGDDDFFCTITNLIILKTCLVYWYCDGLKMFVEKSLHYLEEEKDEKEEELRKEKSEMNKLKREKKKEKKRQQKEASIPKKIRIRKSYLQPGMEEFKGQQIKKEIFSYDFQLDELGYL